MQPVLTRLITRCFGLIPSLVVAVAVGRPGIATLLVASQVVLSIVLPFVTFPLILLTSSKQVMTVYEEVEPVRTSASSDTASASEQASKDESDKDDIVVATVTETVTETSVDVERAVGKPVDFSIGKVMVVIGWVIWVIVVAANVYAIVELGLGQAS